MGWWPGDTSPRLVPVRGHQARWSIVPQPLIELGALPQKGMIRKLRGSLSLAILSVVCCLLKFSGETIEAATSKRSSRYSLYFYSLRIHDPENLGVKHKLPLMRPFHFFWGMRFLVSPPQNHPTHPTFNSIKYVLYMRRRIFQTPKHTGTHTDYQKAPCKLL